MTGSAIGSPMLRARAPLMLNLPEQAWFDVRLMHKDIRLALQTARKLNVPVPSAAAADGLLARAEELSYARHDIAALFQVLARTAFAPGATAGPVMPGRPAAGSGRDAR